MSGNGTQSGRRSVPRALRGCLLPTLAAVLGLAPLACGGGDDGASSGTTATTAASPPSRSLTTGFETGTPRGLTDDARARVTAASAKTGRFGFEVDAVASDAYGRWDAGATGTDRAFWSFRASVRVLAWTPDESVDLFTVRNLEVADNFDLFIGAGDRSFQWDLYREDSARTSAPVELGRWYLVEARGSFASGTSAAEVRIDGVPQPSIASAGRPPSAVKDFVLGSVGTKKTNRVQFDDVRIEVSDQPVARFGAPVGTP